MTLHPEFSFMPRKFKIAVGASAHDRAALRIHDLALRLHRNDAGEAGFEVMVGGGLGRTPFLAKTIRPFLPTRDVLSYVEAVLRTYNQFGRRDNAWKARIKILVHDLGVEAFAKEVEAEWQSMKDDGEFIMGVCAIRKTSRRRFVSFAFFNRGREHVQLTIAEPETSALGATA